MQFKLDLHVIKALFAVWTILLSAPNADAASVDKIKKRGFLDVCVNPDAMPFSHGPMAAQGFEIDLANAIARTLGVDTNFTWAQFRHEARYTNCDAFMSVAVLNDEKNPLKKTKPFMQFETIVVFKTVDAVSAIDQLKGKRVAIQSGSMAHAALLDSSVDIRVSFVGDEAVINAVNNGDVDFGVVGNFSLGWYLKQHPDANLRWVSASFLQSLTGYPVAMGLRQSTPESVEIFNAALNKLDETGELNKIKAKWGFDLVK